MRRRKNLSGDMLLADNIAEDKVKWPRKKVIKKFGAKR